MKELLEAAARGLADHPDRVSVEESIEGDVVTLELAVAPEDLGQVIGREGRTARALRALAAAAGNKHHRRVNVRIRS